MAAGHFLDRPYSKRQPRSDSGPAPTLMLFKAARIPAAVSSRLTKNARSYGSELRGIGRLFLCWGVFASPQRRLG